MQLADVALLLALSPPDDAALQAFRAVVAPTLANECVRCHGETRPRAQLRVDSRAALLEGGKRGAALVPGDAASSRLVAALRHADDDLKMPPKRALPAEVVAAFEAWIAGGAPWPAGFVLEEADSPTRAAPLADSWAFDPPRRHEPPAVATAGFVRDPLDAFVAAKLEAAGLAPSPEADRRTLLRRATLLLHGLAPTPEAIAAFVADPRPDAWPRQVDALLASPRFGERLAIDWLDVVRFAETNGFEMNQPRSAAWPYRDWVIAAFNDDLPWRDFVRAQLAGDQLGIDAATGFLVAGAWDEVKSPDPELTAVQRDDELHGMVATAGAAFLGLTVGCAKCHDHKFDPLTQRDYFGLRACFEGVQFGTRPWRDAALASELPGRQPLDARRNEERFAPLLAERVRFVVNATNGGEPCLDELELWSVGGAATDAGTTRANVALASRGARVRSSGDYAGNPRHALAHLNDGRYGNDRSWIAAAGSGFVEVELAAPTWVDTLVWGRDREGVFADRLATDYQVELLVAGVGWRVVATSRDRQPPRPLPPLYAGRFDPEPAPTRRLDRGNPVEPREEVSPGPIAALAVPFPEFDADDEPARRLALADWIAAPHHPLTARVAVNRLWQFAFGRGLVDTPSDFGAMGGKPTHPELLDTLALDFAESGGRVKPLVRRLLLSATWCQSSAPRDEALAVDADTRLLWRCLPRRAPAEALRDSMVAAAGLLDLRMGGPGFSHFRPNDNYVRLYEPKEQFGADDFRRAVYATRVRMHPDPTFGLFDAPDGGQPCPRRAHSTTPLQALALAHAPLLVELAARFAARVERETGPDAPLDRQIDRAFALAFQRAPDAVERAAVAAVVRDHGLAAGCHALLASSEFGAIE
ncbi:MAG: PSD1 domain-containing protein [Planctomycetes bacterium]|nr:PSD1 domain-containing protein [Planctomycetota bacterium]